ncbi:MAG: hypothetical protein HeimC3_26540 [Candidatus Heimdallarchaeota archaeon LC_3]|nr:MAG: hypothetical protein HeimC3_26540 [Candidatus Heimdallarchaeota archaeon LC_3]
MSKNFREFYSSTLKEIQEYVKGFETKTQI